MCRLGSTLLGRYSLRRLAPPLPPLSSSLLSLSLSLSPTRARTHAPHDTYTPDTHTTRSRTAHDRLLRWTVGAHTTDGVARASSQHTTHEHERATGHRRRVHRCHALTEQRHTTDGRTAAATEPAASTESHGRGQHPAQPVPYRTPAAPPSRVAASVGSPWLCTRCVPPCLPSPDSTSDPHHCRDASRLLRPKAARARHRQNCHALHWWGGGGAHPRGHPRGDALARRLAHGWPTFMSAALNSGRRLARPAAKSPSTEVGNSTVKVIDKSPNSDGVPCFGMPSPLMRIT